MRTKRVHWPEALMEAFVVVVDDKFTEQVTQMPLAEDGKVAQALLTNGSDESFRVWIAVGAFGGNLLALDPGGFERVFDCVGEQWVAIMN